ncbi:RnfABCDGE type electron transport complex subunit B [Salinicola aestuarinus]|uniref:RnfABCDGE type electron transport complex subunit B n=1 Tax=Salinicola aestuarinus TaxID=1949082 RepID=UPI000DA1D6D5|nr:RnfABCDGE type electron transport complex subunit B [Salinicola aestuarinus]
MSLAEIPVERIDAELPQTQCGKCGHAGCRPYAEAIVDGEAINRCPPGGEATRDRLAALTGQPPLELIEPAQTPLLAVIREAECIGCTKCIQACPVDAIVGAAKQMHSVIESECTGCELCVAPCPVDCIDLIEHPMWTQAANETAQDRYLQQRAVNGRQRFDARQRRLAHLAEEKRRRRERRMAAYRAKPEAQASETAVDDAGKTAETPVDHTALKARRATLKARVAKLDRQMAKATAGERAPLEARRKALGSELEALDGQLATPSDETPSNSRGSHLAASAAREALRKARQQLAHFRRQHDNAGMARAEAQIADAQRLLARAGETPGGDSGPQGASS